MAADGVVADLAEGQWGLLTAAQARRAGLSRVQLSRLTQAGVLLRLAHGVYVLRGAGGDETIELRAAWLSLDPERTAARRVAEGAAGAVVSHASASALYGFGDLDADRHEFTVPARKQTRRPGVRLYRAVLDPGEVTVVEGLPVTRPARIVADLLAAGHDGEHVAGVLAAAVRARVIDLAYLAPRLNRFAARFGLTTQDGQGLLEHLLELGGVADQVAAEEIVGLARTGHQGVAAWAASALGAETARLARSVSAFQQSPMLATAMRRQLAAAAILPNAKTIMDTMTTDAAKGYVAAGTLRSLGAGASPFPQPSSMASLRNVQVPAPKTIAAMLAADAAKGRGAGTLPFPWRPSAAPEKTRPTGASPEASASAEASTGGDRGT